MPEQEQNQSQNQNQSKDEVLVGELLPAETVDSEVAARQKQLLALPHEDQCLHAWDFRVKGMTLTKIGQIFKVPLEKVHEMIRVAGRLYREELLGMDAIDIIAQNAQWLDEMERVALSEAHQLQIQTIKHIDPETGKVTEEKIVDPNRAKFFQAALKAREMKLKLMADTGILPKDSPEALHRKLSDLSPQEEEVSKTERTEEEIMESIERLMKHGHFMLPAKKDIQGD